MAKFELRVFNAETGEVEKTLQRDFMPVSLFLKFQQFSESLTGGKMENDAAMFTALKDLYTEMFPSLTSNEYLNNTDTAEVLSLFKYVLVKATQITGATKKNA